MFSRQRIRDPLHNLIEFEADEFENTMWQVLQTRPFQRLRRVKQLGFSELVYPGATHTRFAHSLGVFHTARQLMQIIGKHLGTTAFEPARAQHALAAALLHDAGHGPFSHAFEEVGKSLNSRLMQNHENISDALIRDGEIREALKPLGSGFADDVADLIKGSGPTSLYGSVVSSQFDADRLDYMRRDCLMTGTRHGAIDFDWLISNLEISDVPYGVEKKKLGALKTFVLGPKAIYAAETYVLALFQLYPAVYFHKATRGAEKIFAQLLLRVVTLVREGSVGQTGLSTKHPLIAFVRDTENVERILDLDDTVIWGALTMMAGAKDKDISHFARCLRDRRLYKCVDVRERLAGELRDKGRLDDLRLDKGCAKIQRRIESWIDEKGIAPSKILIDQGKREPYKRFQEDKGPLNQIMVKSSDGRLHDLVNFSPAVKAIKAFKFFRVYVPRDNREVLDFIEKEIRSQGRK